MSTSWNGNERYHSSFSYYKATGKWVLAGTDEWEKKHIDEL